MGVFSKPGSKNTLLGNLGQYLKQRQSSGIPLFGTASFHVGDM
jgi:hypothetical protein